MPKCIHFLIPLVLITQCAFAEDRQLKLLNPDGTPAIDAQAVAVMTLGARVDENLKELPSLVAMLPKRGTAPANNISGTITFDSGAKAIVAQSDSGFAFFPLNSNVTTIKLRPWATFKLDVSKVPADRLKSKRFSIVWTNCFAGNAPRPNSEDPFGGSGSLEDWRFDPFVTWSRTYDDPTSTIKVPPGEVTVVMSDEGFEAVDAQNPIASVRFTLVRTLSKTLSTFILPDFGSATGSIAQQSDLPDWNHERGSMRYVRASRFQGYPVTVPAELESAFVKVDLNSLASFYATEKGAQFRGASLPEVISLLNSDDSFRFENIPAGTYSLEIASPSGNPQSLKYKADSDNKPLKFTVTAGGSTSIDEADLLLDTHLSRGQLQLQNPKSSGLKIQKFSNDPFAAAPNEESPFESQLNPADADPFANAVQPLPPEGTKAVIDAAVKKAEMKIAKALLQVLREIDYQGTPLRQVMWELQDTCNIPIRINTIALSVDLNLDAETPVTISLPSMTARSAFRHILSSVSADLTFTIRDEVLFVTSKKDAARGSEDELLRPNASVEGKLESSEPLAPQQLDTGKAFIEQWLKSSKNNSNPQALSKALQNHLEQEFDANQKSRQSELERLRILLKQSEAWVNTRQTRRAEIVRKRLEELLEQNKK